MNGLRLYFFTDKVKTSLNKNKILPHPERIFLGLILGNCQARSMPSNPCCSANKIPEFTNAVRACGDSSCETNFSIRTCDDNILVFASSSSHGLFITLLKVYHFVWSDVLDSLIYLPTYLMLYFCSYLNNAPTQFHGHLKRRLSR